MKVRIRLYRTISLTTGEKALIDFSDFKKVSRYKWYLTPDGYVLPTTYIAGQRPGLHRFVLDISGRIRVDHRNRNPLDNRKRNLRVCSFSQNKANGARYRNNTSGYKGVFRDRNGWVARIGVGGNQVYLGRYSFPVDAAKAYDDAARHYFKDFALCNF